ncbi:MAG TPA: hypothetical protein VGK23_00635 [Methanomassiliicoccales archaeon]|jgi:hypothetical protein
MELGKCVLKRIGRMTPLQKVAVMLVIGLVLYGSLIAVNETVIKHDPNVPINDDINFYRNRTSAILNGQIPYKDFSMESPPIIDYIMVPAQLVGGESYQYALYFSLWSIFTGISFYVFLRRYDEQAAFIAGMAFMFLPYPLIDSPFGVQDEAITTLVFLLPLFIFVLGRLKTSVLVETIGIWTKFFNGIIYMVFLIKAPTRKDAWKMFGITALIMAAVIVPFLIIAPDKFLSFPSYYLLQDKNAQTGGMSAWHFWDLGGYTLPGTIGVIMTLVTIAGASYYVYRKRDTTTFWEGCFIVMMVFFLFYPKIHLGYYLMIVALLLAWGATNRKILVRCFLSYLPLGLTVLFAEHASSRPTIDFPGSWFIGFLLVMIGNIFLIDTFIKARKERVFFERKGPVLPISDK